MRVWIVQLTYALNGTTRVEDVFETEEAAKAYIKSAEHRPGSEGYVYRVSDWYVKGKAQ